MPCTTCGHGSAPRLRKVAALLTINASELSASVARNAPLVRPYDAKLKSRFMPNQTWTACDSRKMIPSCSPEARSALSVLLTFLATFQRNIRNSASPTNPSSCATSV